MSKTSKNQRGTSEEKQGWVAINPRETLQKEKYHKMNKAGKKSRKYTTR